jgi:hypothetical protein
VEVWEGEKGSREPPLPGGRAVEVREGEKEARAVLGEEFTCPL